MDLVGSKAKTLVGNKQKRRLKITTLKFVWKEDSES